MILPSGVNKATGLAYALAQLNLSPHDVVGVGDAENDHAFLALCEWSVAVDNALPSLKQRADWVTPSPRGRGVVELTSALLAEDGLPAITRHDLTIGVAADGVEVHVPPYGEHLLLAGTSGSGKSTFATAFVEELAERGYQFLIVDPEGDYEKLAWAATLGDRKHAPTVDEVIALLQAPERHLVVNLLGIAMPDRPAFFAALVPRLQELHGRTGRPHWVVIDEAHHMLPEDKAQALVPHELHGLLLITVHPEHVAQAVLEAVRRVIVIGKEPASVLRGFAERLSVDAPAIDSEPLPAGEAITWTPRRGAPLRLRTIVPRSEHRRHVRKYAEGELAPERSFYFRGPDAKLNLRAHNLQLFVQMATGVDDATWMHHLRQGDYSQWFREAIKDEGLADEAAAVETDGRVTAAASRERIRLLIEERYTAPA
jgi:phosphoglycolate phosphatase-like HAD superfamily hydrolase